MKITPENGATIRDILKIVGVILTSRGVFNASDAVAWDTVSTALIPLIQSIGGLALTAFGIIWSRLAKKPASGEAQVIAGRVNADPTTQAIEPQPKEAP
jgi:hypothetical protein